MIRLLPVLMLVAFLSTSGCSSRQHYKTLLAFTASESSPRRSPSLTSLSSKIRTPDKGCNCPIDIGVQQGKQRFLSIASHRKSIPGNAIHTSTGSGTLLKATSLFLDIPSDPVVLQTFSLILSGGFLSGAALAWFYDEQAERYRKRFFRNVEITTGSDQRVPKQYTMKYQRMMEMKKRSSASSFSPTKWFQQQQQSRASSTLTPSWSGVSGGMMSSTMSMATSPITTSSWSSSQVVPAPVPYYSPPMPTVMYAPPPLPTPSYSPPIPAPAPLPPTTTQSAYKLPPAGTMDSSAYGYNLPPTKGTTATSSGTSGSYVNGGRDVVPQATVKKSYMPSKWSPKKVSNNSNKFTGNNSYFGSMSNPATSGNVYSSYSSSSYTSADVQPPTQAPAPVAPSSSTANMYTSSSYSVAPPPAATNTFGGIGTGGYMSSLSSSSSSSPSDGKKKSYSMSKWNPSKTTNSKISSGLPYSPGMPSTTSSVSSTTTQPPPSTAPTTTPFDTSVNGVGNISLENKSFAPSKWSPTSPGGNVGLIGTGVGGYFAGLSSPSIASMGSSSRNGYSSGSNTANSYVRDEVEPTTSNNSNNGYSSSSSNSNYMSSLSGNNNAGGSTKKKSYAPTKWTP